MRKNLLIGLQFKLTCLMLFVCCTLLIPLNVQAQRVNLDLKNATIKEAVIALQQQGYSISVKASDVDMDKRVSVSAVNRELQSVVDEIFAGQKVTCIITGKSISVVKEIPTPEKSAAQQSITYSGVVKDDKGEVVIGATVMIKGTTNGTTTGVDGTYKITASTPNPTLHVSFMGYQTEDVKLSPSLTRVNVTLKSSAIMVDDVVVVGYGVQSKRDVSTAISQVKSEDIANLPSADFRQSLIGKMPGVSVMQTSGDPEGNVLVRVRGVSSATAGNNPLYIIDGVPVENGLANFNTNDIESLEVLKDASSAAIYGSRGSNGVILITTKKGKTDKVSVSYDGYYGLDQVTGKLDMMNAYQYAEFAKDARDAAYFNKYPGGTLPNGSRPESFMNYTVDLLPYLYGTNGLNDTDWQDAIFRTASTMSHNVSVSGKNKNISYFISGNYFDKEGVILNSDFKKYSVRLNLDGQHKNFKYGVNFSPSYSQSNKVNASGAYGDEGIVQSALASSPIWPIYNPDGSYNYMGNGAWRIGTDYQHNEVLNPVALAMLQSNVIDRVAMVGKVYLGYDIAKNLTFTTSLGGDYYGAHNDQYRSKQLPLLGKDNYTKQSPGTGYSSSGFYYNWLWENQLSYTTTIAREHKLSAVLVQSAQKETYKGNNVTATNYPNDNIETIGGGTVSKGASETTEWSLASYLARLQYSYQGKYMLSAAIRADGSSRFGENNRWGYFPSASAAWRLSAEPFFANAKGLKWVDDIKLRASWGKTGNFQIGNYQHLSTMASDDYILGLGSGSLAYGYKPTGIENPDLTWEKTAMTNAGIDIALWGGYLGFTAEYYYSNTTDMLLDVPVSHLTGYTTTLMNVGKINNRGWELSLTSQHKYQSGFGYSFNANFATNTNEVKALGANGTSIIKSGSVEHAYYITEIGKPVGSYYLLVQDGVFENAEQLKAYPHFDNTNPGDFRFVDVDKDGVMDLEKDRAIVGNYMPDFTYGFGGAANYKGLDFSFSFSGVYGNEILNLNRRYIDNMEGNTNGTTIALNRWRSAESIGNGAVNRANRKQTGYNGRTSTWHVEDGSYLRLQNLALGYTLPVAITKKFYVEKLRIYLSTQNLVTWTDYSGYNPEVSLRTGTALTPGEDYGTYPLARTFMVGLNITF